MATTLDIDTATYCKIEKAEPLALWLTDQIAGVVDDEHKVADKALSIAKKEK